MMRTFECIKAIALAPSGQGPIPSFSFCRVFRPHPLLGFSSTCCLALPGRFPFAAPRFERQSYDPPPSRAWKNTSFSLGSHFHVVFAFSLVQIKSFPFFSSLKGSFCHLTSSPQVRPNYYPFFHFGNPFSPPPNTKSLRKFFPPHLTE